MSDGVKVLLGLLTGVCFGYLLERGGVARFRTIVGQFLLRDFTVMKVMLTAIVVGGAGVYAIVALGLAQLHVKPAQMLAVPVGGLVFGVGMALMGYCPGTVCVAAAVGRRDAWAGLGGVLAGALLYAELAPWAQRTLQAKADWGGVTLASMTGVPAWVFFGGLAAACFYFFRWLERRATP